MTVVTDEFWTPELPLTEGERQRGAFMTRRLKEDLGEVRLITARAPCPDCGTTDAKLFPRVNGQARVHCAACDRWLYFAPKTETGERPRTVETVRRGLKPSQQARILERDGQRCLLCGRTARDVPMTVGHLVSVKDGLAAGLTDAELHDDANLAAMCESCNLGVGGASVAPTTLIRHLAVAVRVEFARRKALPVTPLD